jgi:hypothetical protein
MPSPRRFPPPWSFEDEAIWRAIYETKARCRHFSSCNTSACSRATGCQPKVPKPTRADAQNVVQIITSDKVKTQAYCALTKLEDQVEAAAEKNDNKTLDALSKQAEALTDKLGPEYYSLMDGLEQVDPKSSEAKEFMSILSELDKSCTK